MNLLCPDCGGTLADTGRCDQCASSYEAIATRAPDPYEISGGLDLVAAQDRVEHATSTGRMRALLSSEALTKGVDTRARNAAERARQRSATAVESTS